MLYFSCLIADWTIESRTSLRLSCGIASTSIHIWNLMQYITTALVSFFNVQFLDDIKCFIILQTTQQDISLRTEGMNAFKCWIRQLESGSAMVLLSHALKECPYPALKG
jgi:hypothetical protein